MTDTTTATLSSGIALTDAATAKIRELLAVERRDDLKFRVKVEPGGCSGLKMGISFDAFSFDGDFVDDLDGFEVVVDKMSVPYLDGAVIDFEDTLQKQGFSIDNPNAQGTCACGDSFH